MRVRPSLLILTNVALALVALPVFAQDPTAVAGPAQDAIGQILQTGIMGAISVIEGIVIWYLYRQAAVANKQFVELAIKQTEIIAKNNDLLSRNEDIQKSILERLGRRGGSQ